jgi:hypothetical protein
MPAKTNSARKPAGRSKKKDNPGKAVTPRAMLDAPVPAAVTHALAASVPLNVAGNAAAVMCCPVHLRERDPQDLPIEPLAQPQVATRAPVPRPRSGTSVSAVGASAVTTGTTASAITDMEVGFREQLQNLLDRASGQANGLLDSIDAAADTSYDFSEYVFLRDPDDPYVDPRTAFAHYDSTPRSFSTDPKLAALDDAATRWITELVRQASRSARFATVLRGLQEEVMLGVLLVWWRRFCKLRAFNRLALYSAKSIAALNPQQPTTPTEFYGLHLYLQLGARAFDDMVDSFEQPNRKLATVPFAPFWEALGEAVFDIGFAQVDFADAGDPNDYGFDPFSPDEVLFGLQVVHRQSWQLQGYGRGELVRSIPLGPREVQKVSVKVVTRDKYGRTLEEGSSYETNKETATTDKQTRDDVAETSEKLNMHAEAEVSGGYGPFIQAKVSGGIASDMANSSRTTQNRLNETMEKSASRMKRDSKVVVSTEGERTYQVDRASELVNPNDEIAVTYMYHRLQQRYWVSTRIAEVHSVVFVPERVPAPGEITEAWVARHGDALARVLLDPALAGVLNMIRKEPTGMGPSQSDAFGRAAEAAIGAATNFRTYTGQGTMPDFLASGVAYLERDLERRTASNADATRRNHQSDALLRHIRRNILHYMRAIWRAEDFDQRMQRYSRLRVPVEWTFVPNVPPAAGTTPTPLQAEGFFVPAYPGDVRRLTDVIDPIGPIGYLFNCAVYRLRDDNRIANAHQALAWLRSAYARFDVATSVSAGAGVTVRQAVAVSPREFAAQWELRWNAGAWQGQVGATWTAALARPDGSIEHAGVRLWLDGTPAASARVTVTLRVTAEVEDPQVRFAKLAQPLPPPADEPRQFTGEVLRAMAQALPLLRRALGGAVDWAALTAEQKRSVREHWHQWIVMRRSGRLVPIETSNVVLDLEASSTPILEPFKRLHRYIDVMREYETVRRMSLENERRRALLDLGRLGDPEIERVTLVSSDATLAGLVDTDTPDQPT